jgi:hypothetical protein
MDEKARSVEQLKSGESTQDELLYQPNGKL